MTVTYNNVVLSKFTVASMSSVPVYSDSAPHVRIGRRFTVTGFEDDGGDSASPEPQPTPEPAHA